MDKSRLKKYLRPIWVLLLLLSYGSLSYYCFGGWWHSSVGTILILVFSYLIWEKGSYRTIGLKIDLKTFIITIILAIITIFGAVMIMRIIADRHNFIIRYSDWTAYYHDIFYIINEEIVMGAITLFIMIKKIKIKPIISSLLLAVIFSICHFVFFKWIIVFNDEKGILSIITLINLFLLGLVRNNLIIQTGHIGYSWALHFGWMVVMFASSHINTIDSNIRLSQPDKFNLYLGSVEMLIVSLILVTVSLIYWKKHSPQQQL